MKIKMEQQYRILQVRAKYKTGVRSGVKLDLIVNNLDEFKKNMLKLTGADELDVTYESVDENEYDNIPELEGV